MLTTERFEIILGLLHEKGTAKIQEFVEATNSSESTIRRDLSQLESEKKLRRIHGGASLLSSKSVELSVQEKSDRNIEEKKLIAKYAASLVEDGDCIFIDAGTTTYHLIPYITAKDIKIVTNGYPHVEYLAEHDFQPYVTGGLIKQTTKAFVGQQTLHALAQFRFDKCFIGVNGIHPDYGYSTPDPEEAAVKKLAMDLSQSSFVLADQSKMYEVSFANIHKIKEAVIITNQIDEEHLDSLSTLTTVKVVIS